MDYSHLKFNLCDLATLAPPTSQPQAVDHGFLAGAAGYHFGIEPIRTDQGVGFIDFKQLGRGFQRNFIDPVIRPIGQALAPIVQQLFEKLGATLGTIIGGPVGRAIGEGVGHVFGGAVASLMRNEASTSTAIKRALKTSVQVMVSALVLGGSEGIGQILGKMPGHRAIQDVMANPLAQRALPAIIHGDVEILLQDKDFMFKVTEMVPGVGPQAGQLLRNIDSTVQQGVQYLNDMERAGLAAMSNVYGQLQQVDAGAIAHFEGAAIEFDQIVAAIRAKNPTRTQGVGADPDYAAMAIAAIDAAVTPTQAALQRLQAAVLGNVTREQGMAAAAHALDYIGGADTIELPIRFEAMPGTLINSRWNTLAQLVGQGVLPSDKILLSGATANEQGALILPYKAITGGTFQSSIALGDLVLTSDTVVEYSEMQGGNMATGPARLGWVLARKISERGGLDTIEDAKQWLTTATATDLLVARANADTPVRVLDSENKPTGPLISLDVAMLTVAPDTGPRMRPSNPGDKFPARVPNAQIDSAKLMPSEIHPQDRFTNPRYGSIRADGWRDNRNHVTAAEIAADSELVAAKIHVRPQMFARTTEESRALQARYNGKNPPSSDWIAFVLQKGGFVVVYNGTWMSVAEYDQAFKHTLAQQKAREEWDIEYAATFKQVFREMTGRDAPGYDGIDPEHQVYAVRWEDDGSDHGKIVIDGPFAARALGEMMAYGGANYGQIAAGPVTALPNGRTKVDGLFFDGLPWYVPGDKNGLLVRVNKWGTATNVAYEDVRDETLRLVGPRPGVTPLYFGTGDLAKDTENDDVAVIGPSPVINETKDSSAGGGAAMIVLAGLALAAAAAAGGNKKKRDN